MSENIEEAFDYKKSNINFESPNVQGDVGLTGLILKSVSADTVVVSLEDIDSTGMTKRGSFYMSSAAAAKSWRKAKVLLVGPLVKFYQPGDLVIFPNEKGLPTGPLKYRDADGKIQAVAQGHFLSEDRIFGKVENED